MKLSNQSSSSEEEKKDIVNNLPKLNTYNKISRNMTTKTWMKQIEIMH